jgi:MFS transporter, AAHS family, 4-hydroxybenzoate transporter
VGLHASVAIVRTLAQNGVEGGGEAHLDAPASSAPAAIIDAAPLSAFQRRLLVLCGLTVVLDGFDTQTISFVAPSILGEFQAPAAAFGPVMSAALIGILVGAITGGMLADRIGRRRIIIAAAATFGVLSLFTARAGSMDMLMALRFLTGLGLGAAMPNLVAMANEYSPRRLKALTVVLVFAGFPFGAAIGGLCSAALAGAFGWRSVFVVGGVAPLLLALVMLRYLPESLPFLLSRQNARSRELAVSYLQQIAGPSVGAQLAPASSTSSRLSTASVAQLFGGGRTASTLLLWTLQFCTLLIYYFFVSWLPTVLTAAGVQTRVAILVTVLLSCGAIVGGVTLGRFVDRSGSFRILFLSYVAAALVSLLIGFFNDSVAAAAVLVFLAGAFVGGAQLASYALAAALYPDHVRATGVGWAVGASRIGSIIGPLIGSALIARHLDTGALFSLLAIPAGVAACAAGLLARRLAGIKHQAAMN